MEKIKIGTNEFDLCIMGISEKEKSRSFTIASQEVYANIETAFANVTSIQYYSEAGELLTSYLDGISIKTIKHDLESGTYTVEVSTDATITEIRALKAQIAELAEAQQTEA